MFLIYFLRMIFLLVGSGTKRLEKGSRSIYTRALYICFSIFFVRIVHTIVQSVHWSYVDVIKNWDNDVSIVILKCSVYLCTYVRTYVQLRRYEFKDVHKWGEIYNLFSTVQFIIAKDIKENITQARYQVVAISKPSISICSPRV